MIIDAFCVVYYVKNPDFLQYNYLNSVSSKALQSVLSKYLITMCNIIFT